MQMINALETIRSAIARRFGRKTELERENQQLREKIAFQDLCIRNLNQDLETANYEVVERGRELFTCRQEITRMHIKLEAANDSLDMFEHYQENLNKALAGREDLLELVEKWQCADPLPFSQEYDFVEGVDYPYQYDETIDIQT